MRAAFTAASDQALALRPLERVVEPAAKLRENLVADRANDQPVLLTEMHALGADCGLRVERGLRALVAHELARADEADAARVTDERVLGQRREAGLELRRDLSHVLVELALLVDP